MKNQITKITLLGLLAAALVAVPAGSRAQDSTTNAPATTAPMKKAGKNGLPFHGKASAVDTAAMTVTVGTLTINITSTTKISKDGNPATLADITVGETVAGFYKKDDAGKLNATVLRVGAKAKKKTPADSTPAPAAPPAN